MCWAAPENAPAPNNTPVLKIGNALPRTRERVFYCPRPRVLQKNPPAIWQSAENALYLYIKTYIPTLMNAITISPTELRANQKKYFDMAETTRIFVKRGRKLIELVVKDAIDDNPSPSGDAWFDDPRNIAELSRRIEAVRQGNARFTPLEELRKSWEDTE